MSVVTTREYDEVDYFWGHHKFNLEMELAQLHEEAETAEDEALYRAEEDRADLTRASLDHLCEEDAIAKREAIERAERIDYLNSELAKWEDVRA